MSNIVTDIFGRSNTTYGGGTAPSYGFNGNNWTDYYAVSQGGANGEYRIQSNQLQRQFALPGAPFDVFGGRPTSEHVGYVKIAIESPGIASTNYSQRIVARATMSGNSITRCYSVYLYSGTLYIDAGSAGSHNPGASTSFTPTTGHHYGVRMTLTPNGANTQTTILAEIYDNDAAGATVASMQTTDGTANLQFAANQFYGLIGEGTGSNAAITLFQADDTTPAAPAPGAATARSSINGSVLSATAESGGVSPITRQWHRGTSPGFTLSGGTAIGGATGLTYTDAPPLTQTVYYYKLAYTDALSRTAYSNEVSAQQYVVADSPDTSVLYFDVPGLSSLQMQLLLPSGKSWNFTTSQFEAQTSGNRAQHLWPMDEIAGGGTYILAVLPLGLPANDVIPVIYPNTTASSKPTAVGDTTYWNGSEFVRQRVRQSGDSYTRLGVPAGASVSADIAAIGAKTANLPGSFPTNFASLAIDASGRVTLAPAGLDAVVIETGLNARQAIAINIAALGGSLSGATAGGGSITIKGAGVAATRITATGDLYGNRSNVTLSPPA